MWQGLGHGAESREQFIDNRAKKKKRPSLSRLDHAPSIQAQASAQAMKAQNTLIKAAITAITASTMEPKRSSMNEMVYDQRKETPRRRFVLIIEDEVVETPMCGSIVPNHKLRREKPLLTYVSSSDTDARHILRAVADASKNSDNYEKKHIYGTGKEAMDAYQTSWEQRRKARKRKAVSLEAEQTQAAIAATTAPEIVEG